MNRQNLKNLPYKESVCGRYYPDLDIWLWNELDAVVAKGKITEDQISVYLSLAIAVANLWKRQQNVTYDEAVSEEDIKNSYEKNDFFASHFSIGSKENGILRGKTYHEAFPYETDSLIHTIREVLHSDIFSDNKYFTEYLETVMRALQLTLATSRRPAEWLQCDIALAQQQASTFMYLHPLENYWDTTQNKFPNLAFEGDDPWKYFFEGKAFIENPLVTSEYVDRVKQFILDRYKDVIESNSRISFIDMLVIAGGNAAQPNRGQNIPNDPQIRQEYGKQIFMYANTILHKAKHQFLPYKQKYFVYSLVTEDEFIQGGLSHTLNHEIAHNAERFSSVQWLEEMKSSLLSLHCVAGLEASGLLGSLQTTRNAVYEAEIANHLDLFQYRNEQFPRFYYIGENIMLNCWIKNGAIKIHYLSDGTKLEIDYDAMEQAINGLTDEVLQLQDSQRELEFSQKVESFQNKYFSEQIYFDLGLGITAETIHY